MVPKTWWLQGATLTNHAPISPLGLRFSIPEKKLLSPTLNVSPSFEQRMNDFAISHPTGGVV